ncbi:MAG TPA: Gfo/Idh/MocA family oxidoreductase [Bacteroidales bacterium]|nr:Gfo/Idh/MocA family oxidoreductase [Bacteroidales bacterium]
MINWGIIGCGNVTEVKSGPAFNKVNDSRLQAVMRRDHALAEDYAARHKVPRYYTDASLLINDPEINAVYIATPPGNHAEFAIKSIKAGKPVYIEKPMALNFSECQKIIMAGKKYGVPVFVAYYRRALPGFLKVKEIIEKGAIGKIRFAHIQLFKSPSEDELEGNLSWRVDPSISGGGHFFDLASHQLDYLDFLFGPVKVVKSLVLNQGGFYKAEDFVSAQFLFADNICCSGTWSFSSAIEAGRDLIEIIGESGYIRFSCFNFEPIVLETSKGRQEFVNERPENVQIYLIDQVVKSIMGKGNAVSTGNTAARTSWVMDEVVKEYYKKNNLVTG